MRRFVRQPTIASKLDHDCSNRRIFVGVTRGAKSVVAIGDNERAHFGHVPLNEDDG